MLGIGVMVVETTERQKVDELLRARGFLEAVLRSLKEGIVACDADGNLVTVNQTIQDFHGLPLQSVPPQRWAEY
jgi:PAS domain-containing protein